MSELISLVERTARLYYMRIRSSARPVCTIYTRACACVLRMCSCYVMRVMRAFPCSARMNVVPRVHMAVDSCRVIR